MFTKNGTYNTFTSNFRLLTGLGRTFNLCCISLLLFSCDSAAQEPVPESARPAFFEKLNSDLLVHRPTKSSAPKLHSVVRDPIFRTKIKRISAPSQVESNITRMRHYYSKMNPFNADESLAVLFSSDGYKWLYSTQDWSPIRPLKVSSSNPEIQWHPTDPNLFYYMDFVKGSHDVRAFSLYDVANNRGKLLKDFPEYDSVRGRLEGNLDKHGRYYALVGKKEKKLEAFVLDLKSLTTSKRLSVNDDMVGDWISISQSGKYVVMMGDRTRVYDIALNHVTSFPKGTYGHGDLCVAADGREVIVFDGADYQLDNNRNILMGHLDSGKLEIVTRIGWGSTPHISCRNTDLPGWALVSTQGPDGKYPNLDFEIFWVRLDGSGEVRRVAHHHSSRKNGGYFAEQHAVTNKSGSKVIFASNWESDEVNSYLVDLTASTD